MKMLYDKTKPLTKRNLIEFLKSLDIEVKTNTKARGNQGIYLKNRIDIAKNLTDEKAIDVLVHEFAHHIHYKIEKDIAKNGGSIECLFNLVSPNGGSDDEATLGSPFQADTHKNSLTSSANREFLFERFNTSDISEIKSELINVTYLIDKNSRLKLFSDAKEETSRTIKSMQSAIKRDYPEFQRSKKFKEFDKYIKNSEAKFLVKYDAVRLMKGFFFKKEKIITVKNLENDFPQMPYAFQTYIKLCSLQRKQSKLTRRINKMNKYYEKPTELFARFVQGYFSFPETISSVAPKTTKRFKELLESGYYKELKDLFEIFKPISD